MQDKQQQQLHQCSIMEEKTHRLEINLISAQDLNPPSTIQKRFQTYAVAWVDPSLKLRTRIDRLGSENPTWNDKFIFSVPSDFFTIDTSAIMIEIYAVRYIRDVLIGTVRFLVGNSNNKVVITTNPSFFALQIRRPSSGRIQGALNIAVNLIKGGSDCSALNGASAIGYRDLMGENDRRQNQRKRRNPKLQKGSTEGSCSVVNGGNQKSLEGFSSGGGSGDCSSDVESTCSSSTSTASAASSSSVLKDWLMRDKAGRRGRSTSDVLGLLCGLGFQRKIHLSPSDQNLQNLANEE